MKYLLFSVLFLTSGIVIAQDKYLDRQGIISFEASEATFEPVKAKNSSVTAIMNIHTGEIASLALIKEFRFRNALMQEHFNENYIESDSYPKATFKGKVADFNYEELTENEKEYDVSGVLNLHGVDKNIISKLFISKQDAVISLRGNFNTEPKDFNIKIPKIVRNKIAKKVKVRFDFKLKMK